METRRGRHTLRRVRAVRTCGEALPLGVILIRRGSVAPSMASSYALTAASMQYDECSSRARCNSTINILEPGTARLPHVVTRRATPPLTLSILQGA